LKKPEREDLGVTLDSFGVILPLLLIGLIVWLIVRYGRKTRALKVSSLDQQAAERHLMHWYAAESARLSDPSTDPDDLVAFAVARMPEDDRKRVATLDLFRILVRNPSLPSDMRSGLLSRLGAEEASMRSDAKLSRMADELQKKQSGGFMAGGGVEFSGE
jgi:hypothetical protein